MCKCSALPTCFSQMGTKCAVLLVKTETEPLPSTTTLLQMQNKFQKALFKSKLRHLTILSYF